jgi:endonuclease YncB( thermonuclease family)
MKSKMSRALLFMTAFVLLSPLIYAAEISGIVIAISDGDTLTLLTNEKKQIKIRLGSIDAPEKNQPYGDASKQALARKVFKKKVSVIVITTDRYGRPVGTLTLDQRNINRELVSEGHAWAYRNYLKDRHMVRLEENARLSKLGLWRLQSDQIEAPWEWRKNGKSRGSKTHVATVKARSPWGSQCGDKYYCKEMRSCEEAKFFLNTCGVQTVDGDNDGLPCENVCR